MTPTGRFQLLIAKTVRILVVFSGHVTRHDARALIKTAGRCGPMLALPVDEVRYCVAAVMVTWALASVG